MQKAARRKALGEAAQQDLGQLALFRRQRLVIPFGAFHVVDRHERGLAALRETDVVLREIDVDAASERVDVGPLRIGIGFRHARILVHARDAHREREIDVARVGESDDWRGVARIRRAGQREMALAREQARRRIEPDPAGARQVGLGPGVQVGEILVGAGRAVQRLHVGGELDQIARCEARRDAEMAQDLHEHPARVAARALRALERFLGRLHAGLHADEIPDLVLQLPVQTNQHVDRLFAGTQRRAKRIEPGGEPRTRRRRVEERDQLLGERGRVIERMELRIRLDEEIERVDDRHVGDEVDRDVERRGRLGEHEPRDPVSVGVLLPVEEVLCRSDVQRITEHRRAAMRRGPQPDFVRRQLDRPVEAVGRPVLQRDADRHRSRQIQSGSGSCVNTRRNPSPHSLCTIWK